MTTRIIPTKDSIKQKNLKWMNLLVHSHDIFCDCETPLQHTIILICQQEPEIKLKPIEKDIVKRCLIGEPTDTAGTAADDGVEEGLLDALFKEDFGEEDTAG